MGELLIDRTNLRTARIVETSRSPLAAGAARLRIDLFSLTANNVTYAAMGTGPLGYWDFFPGPDGWGKVPCWGFATVAESRAEGVAVGDRFYGYYPVAETLDVVPTRVTPRGFTDGAPHRAAKAAVYNQYLNVTADPAYDAAFEPEQTLFRPLYATGWWAADCVGQAAPQTVVVSSASAKTALALAHRLRRQGGVRVVGLTSPGNADYVRESGLYDETLTYDEAGGLPSDSPSVYVDFLGRQEIVAAAHQALGDSLKRSILIGVTDWADRVEGDQPSRPTIPGPTPEFFFVPTYAAGRLQQSPDLGDAMQQDLRDFYAASRAFVTPSLATGGQAILDSWARLASGEVSPREGLVHGFA